MRESRRTLENPMLYSNFVKKVMGSDPDFDVQLIDRTLAPDEALGDLQKKRHLRDTSQLNPMREYRNSLFDSGIKHPRMQNFVMRQDKVEQDDLDMLAYVMGVRPHRNVKMDIARKAKTAKSVRQYARNPNRYDVPGVDSPGSFFDEDWF